MIGWQVLVLTEFRFDENQNEFLKISGRASGILSWVLSMYGIDPITSLYCNKTVIRYEEASIHKGKKTINIPLLGVTAVASGIHKPFALLVFGILSLVLGTFMAVTTREEGSEKIMYFLIGIIASAVFMMIYALNKTMFFSIYCGGNFPIASIHIKRSVIEGQAIDEQKAAAAAAALTNAVFKIHYLLATAKAR
jgi:uncharacterized membrane protein